jgi:hypothetical protein
MNIGSMNSLNSYLQSIAGTALQGTSLTNTTTKTSSTDATSLQLQPDNGRLSSFAQLMSTLQQLQQSDPAKYQQVTQQIATNLKSAAQTAQAEGNTTAANQLNQLSTDFSNASQTGQLPNMQDLAHAIRGGHHHHHHVQAASSDPSSSSTSAASSSSSSASMDQLLAAFQANTSQSEAIDPMTVIMNTLSNSGISTNT